MTKSKFFDRVATSEDPLLFTETDRRKVLKMGECLGDLTGKRVIEPGCGVGPLTEHLSKWVGPQGHVFAFDASGGMVEQAQRRLGHLKNVEILHAVAETVELQPAAWDLVILFRVFPHFDAKTRILNRCRQWLVPEGRLVIANLEGSEKLNALHSSFSDPVRHDRMPCATEMRRLLEDAGYRVLDLIDEDHEFFARAVAIPPPIMGSSRAEDRHPPHRSTADTHENHSRSVQAPPP